VCVYSRSVRRVVVVVVLLLLLLLLLQSALVFVADRGMYIGAIVCAAAVAKQ